MELIASFLHIQQLQFLEKNTWHFNNFCQPLTVKVFYAWTLENIAINFKSNFFATLWFQ